MSAGAALEGGSGSQAITFKRQVQMGIRALENVYEVIDTVLDIADTISFGEELLSDLYSAKGAIFKSARKSGETLATAKGRAAHTLFAEVHKALGWDKEFVLQNGRRVDALNHALRVIRELKPNNPRAIKQGLKQLQDYLIQREKETGLKWIGELWVY